MKKIKLHLGCGKVFIPDFVHIDLSSYEHIDYIQSIGSLKNFKDSSVDLIYCCHAFEYFDRNVADYVLKEWKRVLKPEGILRLAVPDFESIVKVYQKYNDLEHRGILGPMYGKIVVKKRASFFVKNISTSDVIYHKTIYDFKSLKNKLEKNGFKDIKRYDWRKTEHVDIDDFSSAYIPHMDKENGILISLNVEAKK